LRPAAATICLRVGGSGPPIYLVPSFEFRFKEKEQNFGSDILVSFHPETQSDEIIKKSDLFGREIT
jgi:hypothetical protein